MGKMRNKSVVLIYPRPTQGYLKERRRDIYTVKRIYAPLSIMYLAATLEEAGFSVFLFDHRLISLKDILEKVSSMGDILFFGISTMTGSQIKDGLEIAGKLKEQYGKDIPLVWGGVHPTIFPDKTISHPLVDIVVCGEGDYTIVELAKALISGKSLNTVKGIYFKKGNNITRTLPNKKIESLDVLPIPSWEHFRAHLNFAQYPILASITTSRGCPYNCAYCYKWKVDGATRGSVWRAFSVNRVMKEIDYLYNKYKFDIFEILDENFILDTSRAIELIKGFKSRGLRSSGICSNFLSYNDKIINELPGFCDYVAYSPETGSPKIQKFINKIADYEKMKSLNAKLYDMNISTIHTFIFGFPFETDDDIKATVNLCKDFKKINPASRMALYQYMPYPGAPLTEMMTSKYGLILPENFEEWSKCDMYGELDLKFRPWINQKKLKFLNDFQLLFNTIFNTYDSFGKDIYDIYNSDQKIRELIGDISLIPRVVGSPIKDVLNERITPELIENYKEKFFV